MDPAGAGGLERQAGGQGRFSRAGIDDAVRPHPMKAQEECQEERAQEQQDEHEERDHLNPAHQKVSEGDGLSHSGDPEEEEVIVLVEQRKRFTSKGLPGAFRSPLPCLC